MKKMFLMLFTVALFTTGFTSCRDTHKDASDDIEEAADDIGDEMKDAADDIGDGIKDAADDIDDSM